jgi:hypothetical protein
MRLNIHMLGAKKLRAGFSQVLNHIHMLASAIIAFTGISLA